MSGSMSHVPRRRSLLAFLLGAVTGAILLTPVAVGAASPTAAKVASYTRSASCAGIDFVPNSSTMSSDSNGTERYGGKGYFICDPHLPNGAQVTKVVFTVRDDLSNAQISGCLFVSSDLRVPYATTYYVHSTAPDTGIAAQPGIVQIVGGIVFFPIIDNTKNGYWLQCGSTDISDPGIGIYGAKVIYRISATNG